MLVKGLFSIILGGDVILYQIKLNPPKPTLNIPNLYECLFESFIWSYSTYIESKYQNMLYIV